MNEAKLDELWDKFEMALPKVLEHFHRAVVLSSASFFFQPGTVTSMGP